jgi:CRP/FNR family transcriptional regulator, cyclic AMP receptor protein
MRESGGSGPRAKSPQRSLVANFRHAEEMELQRARRRRDELGHKPLCDRIRFSVRGKSHSRTRRREVTPNGPAVDAQRRGCLGQGPLEDVSHHEGAEVRAAKRIPADQIAEARREEAAPLHRVPDRERRIAVYLTDAQQGRDFARRKPAGMLEARNETLDDNVVGHHRTATRARDRGDPHERGGERAAKAVEIGELHDLDHRGIAEEQARDRSIPLGDDDDRYRVLPRELDLDPDAERGNAGVGDQDSGRGDVRAVDLVQSTWVEVRRRDRIVHPLREIRPQSSGLGDLSEDLVEHLRSRRIVERGKRAGDIRLAEGDGCPVPTFIHGPLMMLGASSCARRIRRMPEQRVSEYLRRLPLFSRLPDSELAELADRVRTKSFKRGEMIFRKDDPGTHLYMVLEGGVKIALPGEFGQEALVAIMRPGEFFGELALFDRSPRSASATALEDTRAALLAGDDFLAYLESHPASFRVVLETLARTIRRLSDRVEDLIFLDVPSRVAKYLLDLVRSSGDGSGNELTLTQDELAAFIGASRVSVNRVLGDLERREIISIRRRRIVIKDADRLAKEVRF